MQELASEPEDWTPPSFAMQIRNPSVAREWRERVSTWELEHAEIASAWEAAFDEDRARAEHAHLISSLRRTGLPMRVVESYVRGLEETPAVKIARTFAASDKTFLLLMGGPGVGKTIATACVLERSAEHALFYRAGDLCWLSAFDASDRAIWARVCNCPVLALDDLGTEVLHDKWQSSLDDLIAIREGDRLKTVITTNLDAAAFKSRYGVRISDRIKGDGFIESCGDKSRRLKSAEVRP